MSFSIEELSPVQVNAIEQKILAAETGRDLRTGSRLRVRDVRLDARAARMLFDAAIGRELQTHRRIAALEDELEELREELQDLKTPRQQSSFFDRPTPPAGTPVTAC